MNLTTSQKSFVIALVAISSLHSNVCSASIVGTSGAIDNNGQLTSGTDLGLNGTVSDTEIRLYTESQVTLSQNLSVDKIGSAFTTSGTIASGTMVDSYLLHFDSDASQTINLSGTVTFNEPILGIEIDDASLNATDSTLGVAGVTYYKGGSRGLEANDTFSINGDSLTFSGDFTVSTEMDEVRIITAVPEPTTFVAGAMMILPFGAGAFRQLRKKIKTA